MGMKGGAGKNREMKVEALCIWRCREVQGSAGKCRQVRGGAKRWREVLGRAGDAGRCSEAQRGSSKSRVGVMEVADRSRVPCERLAVEVLRGCQCILRCTNTLERC
jgi:hypothetical protein